MEVEPQRVEPAGRIPFPPENIYGHLERVRWFTNHLTPADRILEVGCGTGYRITLPLRAWGYDVRGIDVDARSIECGRGLMRRAGLDEDLLLVQDLADVSDTYDAIILSEVCEHVSDRVLDQLLKAVHARLRESGRILVTVPNGYGWFELEAFLWHRVGAGRLLTASGIAFAIRRLKGILVRGAPSDPIPSTLSRAPHIQRFTLAAIEERLARAGFRVVDARGSVLFCGPFSDMMLSGSINAMHLNSALGRRLGRFSAGFYLAGQRI